MHQVGKEYIRPMLSNMVATSPHVAKEHLKCDSCDLRCAISVNYTPDFEYSVHKISVKYSIHNFCIDYMLKYYFSYIELYQIYH